MVDRYEVIGILPCEDVTFLDFFDKCIIDRPQKMSLRFENIQEMEIRFINLVTGQILNSSFDSNSNFEELFITLSFSEI